MAEPVEAGRPHRVTGLWGYVDPIGVLPGRDVALHASLEAAARIDLVRLGRHAILDPDLPHPEASDRTDVEIIASVEQPTALPQVTRPGSHVVVGGAPIVGKALTLAAWIRPWALPARETNQWYAAGIITDLDYPMACRFGLLIDAHGGLCAYAGDGGWFDHARLLTSASDLRSRLGTWLHVACSFEPHGSTLWIDGMLDARDETDASAGLADPRPRSRLRIGALAEDGLADGHSGTSSASRVPAPSRATSCGTS